MTREKSPYMVSVCVCNVNVILDTVTAFSVSRYFVHSVSTRVLEVRYSCYYILLILSHCYEYISTIIASEFHE